MIRIFHVDDDDRVREAVRQMLELEPDMQLVGEADRIQGTLERIEKARPHVVLLDVQLPDGDGPGLAAALGTLASPPAVIMLSVQKEMAYLRRSMMAGAKDYLLKPFTPEDLQTAVRSVFESSAKAFRDKGRIVGFLGCRGGVGTTTAALSIGAALADYGARVALVDGNLTLGDMAFMLNIRPEVTWADWSTDCMSGEKDTRKYLESGPGGVEVLCAPLGPAQAELVKSESVPRALGNLRESFDLVLVDIPPVFSDPGLEMLEAAQDLVFVTDPSLSGLKNLRLLWELMDQLRFPHEERVVLLNRVEKKDRKTVAEISKTHPGLLTLPSEAAIEESWLRGQPPVMGLPRSPYSKQIGQLARRWRPAEEPK